MVLSVWMWLMVCTCGRGLAWVWLGLRGPTQFCCSLSRVLVSPGPLSGPSAAGGCCNLKEREEVWEGGGLLGAAGVLVVEDEVWESRAGLLGGCAAWGNDWLGLRADEEVIWGTEGRPIAGGVIDTWRPAGGVANSRGLRVPGGVTGGRDTDVSRRVRLPSGDCGVLSSLDARRPFWYWARVTWEEKAAVQQLRLWQPPSTWSVSMLPGCPNPVLRSNTLTTFPGQNILSLWGLALGTSALNGIQLPKWKCSDSLAPG